ncbi:hypothetical protein [Microcoleus sp. CAWBG58]|uniref:hypothetical protein n=1 Tax=Microcoleus sp. CAWBG58 TaxID=2841651 RepID=UPI0025D74F72|nr:hypothetical protein [Microcoleus sp. CAWBG58]
MRAWKSQVLRSPKQIFFENLRSTYTIFLRICIRLLRKFWRRNQKVDRPFGF